MLSSVRSSLAKSLKRFGRSECGMTLPLTAVSLVVIVSMMGLAIDVARTQLVQSKLQFSLDAAGLAAGSTVSTADISAEANKYLNVNFNGYLGAQLTGVQVTPNTTTTIITLTATATMPTTFLKALGITQVTLNANSQVSRKIKGLEVTVIVDVSYGDDLTDFKAGLTNFINKLFASAPGADGALYVSIVPFNQFVNVGTAHAGWTVPNTTSPGWGPSNSWGGCVDARSGTHATVDDPPSVAPFNQSYYASDTAATLAAKMNVTNTVATTTFNNYSQWGAVNSKQQTDSQNSCAFQYDMGVNVWQGVVPVNGVNNQTYASPLNTSTQGPNFMCPPPIAALTSDVTTALNEINNVQWVQGDWLPDQGLLWGWNTLSPRWKGLWGNVTDSNGQALPHDYNTSGWNKAVVWVEGYSMISIPGGCRNNWGSNYNIIDNEIRGAYGYLSEGNLGTTDQNTAASTVQNRAQQICQAIKQDNVYVYLLGYSANGSASGLPSFELNCATGPNYAFWFGPGDWGAFDTALNSIADSLVNLWVSK